MSTRATIYYNRATQLHIFREYTDMKVYFEQSGSGEPIELPPTAIWELGRCREARDAVTETQKQAVTAVHDLARQSHAVIHAGDFSVCPERDCGSARLWYLQVMQDADRQLSQWKMEHTAFHDGGAVTINLRRRGEIVAVFSSEIAATEAAQLLGAIEEGLPR